MIDMIMTASGIAVPEAADDPDVLDCYVRRVLATYDLRDRGTLRVLLSPATLQRLAAIGGWPFREPLRRCLERCKSQHASLVDLIRVSSSILERSIDLESHLGVSAVLFDSCETEPDITAALGGHEADFGEVSALVCIDQNRQKPVLRALALVIMGPASNPVSVSIKVVDAEMDSAPPALNELPARLQCDVHVTDTPTVAVTQTDAASLLYRDMALQELASALSTAILQAACDRPDEGDKNEFSAFLIQPTFLETAAAHGFLHVPAKSRKLLRTMVETVLAKNLRFTHWLREGPGPEEPQLMRGGDGAWRRDVDDEYRIHYWSTQQGPEFACLCSHNQFSIPR